MSSTNRFDLTGRVAIITGGAGDIGKVYARALREAGASVVIADLAVTAADAVADELRDSGFRAHACRVDVTSTESVNVMAQSAIDTFGGVDILINNAAIMTDLPRYGLRNIPASEWDKVMAVNVRGPLLCSQAVAGSMSKRGGGRIVNGLSAGAFIPGGIYSISKVALNALTVNLAHEFGSRGINVNAIAPGFVESDSGYAALPKDSDFRTTITAPFRARNPHPPPTSSGPFCCCAHQPATGSTARP